MYHLVISGLQGQTLGQYRLQDGQGARIQALDNVRYQISDATSGLGPQSLQTARAGNDLLVYLEGEASPELIVENYYLLDETGLKNPLLGLNDYGQYVAYPVSEAPALPVEHLLAEEVGGASVASGASAGTISPAIALASLAGIAVSGAVIAGSSKDDDNPADSQQPEQPQTPFNPHQPSPPSDNDNTLPPPPADNGQILPPPPSINPPPGNNNPPPPAPNNRAPTDIDLPATTVMEGKDGVVIATLTTTDPDQEDSHTYSVNDDRFEIVNNELKLKAGQTLNYDNEKEISLTITATDKAGATYQESFTLQVQDDPSYPAPPLPTSTKESGLNLDMARHFYTLPTLKAFVDTLAKAGGTFFHLHFSDNENYALESALLGQTTTNATQRADGVWINNHTQKPFLSSAQLAELVDYAQAKNIALVPELDMPAHIKAVLELLHHARGKDYVDSIKVPWPDKYGNPVYQLDTNRPQARALAKALIDEIAEHFKHARHFHIGGDEFHGAEAHNHEYIAFANDIAAYLADKGLKTRMWNDGILKTALASLDANIEITYWNFDGDKQGNEATHNRLVRASFLDLIDAGFTVLNYNNAYLYHVPEAQNYSSLSQSDHEMYTRLQEWHLGLWDGKDTASAVSDPGKIAGGAMSIWGDKAVALADTSIEKFTESQLGAIIRMINAAADPQSADAQALKSLQDALRAGDYSGMEHPVYLDLERAPQTGSLDTGALGKQHIHLLRGELLDDRDQFEFFIRGDKHDTLTLDDSWQKTAETVTRQNPEYADDMVTYRAYTLGDDKLWIDEDLQLYWI